MFMISPYIGIASGILGSVVSALYILMANTFSIKNVASALVFGIVAIPFIIISSLIGTFAGGLLGIGLSKII
jgi:hypothetical protein